MCFGPVSGFLIAEISWFQVVVSVEPRGRRAGWRHVFFPFDGYACKRVAQLLLHLLILNRSQMTGVGLLWLALVYVAAVGGIYGFAVIKSVKSVQITMTATREISVLWVWSRLW